MDTVIMICILLFLAFDILYESKLLPCNDKFFGIQNSQAMRGFWCLIIILVHVPAEYQNRIQDMIGSFAYIGVTFFFLTSGYGLTLSADKNPMMISHFWRKRLPKILIISWMVNLLFETIGVIIFGYAFSIIEVLLINQWVIWLLMCYLLFWLSYKVFGRKKIWKVVTCLGVILGSIIVYFLKYKELITGTTWTTECYGFVWGIILATIKENFMNYYIRKWNLKWTISCIISLVLGVSYLVLKSVPFGGDYILKILLGFAITMFVLIANTRIYFGNKINLLLGNISFEIYLIHGHVFNLFRNLHDWRYSSVYILSCIIVTIMASFLINLIVERTVRMIMSMLKCNT